MRFKHAAHVIFLVTLLSTGPALTQETDVPVDKIEHVDESASTPTVGDIEAEVGVSAGVVTHASQPTDVGTAIVKLMEGLQNKNWLLVSCAALMVLIWVWNIFIMPRLISNEKHPKWRAASPRISIGVAVAAQFASAVIAGNSWTDAINTAVVMGFAASGMWSAGGKKALGMVENRLASTTKKTSSN